jgi:hypothetical protein
MRAGAALLFGAALVAAGSGRARGDLVRGSIKVDVRDAAGKPHEAEVHVRGASGEAKAARVGDVYVASGLVDGDYEVTVGEAKPQTVHVAGRMDRGVVFVVGGKKAESVALGPRDVACDAVEGVVVEAVAFARGGGLGAGRIDVRRHGGGKSVCSAIVAGGAATLRLLPGDYIVAAKMVGGGKSEQRYVVKRDQTPTPLAIRAR